MSAIGPDGRCPGLRALGWLAAQLHEHLVSDRLRPYYIAIFASLYRLYRSLAPDGRARSELVAPWVETSLYVHRDPVSGMPSVLDFSKELKPDADVGDRGAPGPAQPAA